MAFDSRESSGPGGPGTVPSTCPACGSSAITTTAKSPATDAYWRCEKCGEVWNVARRGSRPAVNRWR